MGGFGRTLVVSGAVGLGSVGIHAALGGTLGWLLGADSVAPSESSSASTPAAPAKPEALPDPQEEVPTATLDPDFLLAEVAAGRLLLGEALIAKGGLTQGREREARVRYRRLLGELRSSLPLDPAEVPRRVVSLLRARGLDSYRALYHDLASALLHRGGDCRARTETIVSLLYDAGFRQQTGARVFSNHMAPVFQNGKKEQRFGLVKDCTGLGVRIDPRELLRDELPESRDHCRDERPLIGSGLSDQDPEPSWSGQPPAEDELCPLAEWPWREPGDPVELESEAEPRAIVTWLEPSWADLETHAAGIDCHTRWLRAISARPPSTDRWLSALGRAVAYGEETALEFVAAGELASARSVEQTTREWRRQAERLLADWDYRGVPLRAELSSLIHLGSEGQSILLALVPRHSCWFGSDFLAILLREPATRDRALGLYLSRSLPQQIETADRMYWTDEEFQRSIERHPAGRRALLLRTAVDYARRRWQSCHFGDLVRAAEATVAEFALDLEWASPLVAVLAEDARVHLGDHQCRVESFNAQVRSWAHEQPSAIGAWLERQSRER
jgi:hypothetical protein